VRIALLSRSRSTEEVASFTSSSLLLGFTRLPTDGHITGIPVDHVTNMAADWRKMLRRYVDAHFRLHAADKIFNVIAHNYDQWEEKSGSFLTWSGEMNRSEEVRGREVSGDHGTESEQSREIAGELLEDCAIAAPTIRMAKCHVTCSQRSRDTYLYYFNGTGVAHDLLTYVFGAPLSPGIDPFHPRHYTDTDRQVAVDVIKHWANFIHSGQVCCLNIY